MNKIFRFKLTENMCNNVSYLIVSEKGISYCGKSGMPFSLSNIVDDAMAFRFLLSDIYNSKKAVKVRLHQAIKSTVKYMKKIEVV